MKKRISRSKLPMLDYSKPIKQLTATEYGAICSSTEAIFISPFNSQYSLVFDRRFSTPIEVLVSTNCLIKNLLQGFDATILRTILTLQALKLKLPPVLPIITEAFVLLPLSNYNKHPSEWINLSNISNIVSQHRCRNRLHLKVSCYRQKLTLISHRPIEEITSIIHNALVVHHNNLAIVNHEHYLNNWRLHAPLQLTTNMQKLIGPINTATTKNQITPLITSEQLEIHYYEQFICLLTNLFGPIFDPYLVGDDLIDVLIQAQDNFRKLFCHTTNNSFKNYQHYQQVLRNHVTNELPTNH